MKIFKFPYLLPLAFFECIGIKNLDYFVPTICNEVS